MTENTERKPVVDQQIMFWLCDPPPYKPGLTGEKLYDYDRDNTKKVITLSKDGRRQLPLDLALRYLHPGQPFEFTETVISVMRGAQHINHDQPFFSTGNEAERIANPDDMQDTDMLKAWFRNVRIKILELRTQSPEYSEYEKIAQETIDRIDEVALNGDYPMQYLLPNQLMPDIYNRVIQQMDKFQLTYSGEQKSDYQAIKVLEWQKLYAHPRLDVWFENPNRTGAKLGHPEAPQTDPTTITHYEWRIEHINPKENPQIDLVIFSGGVVTDKGKFYPNIFQAYSQLPQDMNGFIAQRRTGPYVMDRQSEMKAIMDPLHNQITLPEKNPYDLVDGLPEKFVQAITDKNWQIASVDRLMISLVRSFRKVAFINNTAYHGYAAGDLWNNFPEKPLNDYKLMVAALAEQFKNGTRLSAASFKEMTREITIMDALTPNFFLKLASDTGFLTLFPRTTGIEFKLSNQVRNEDDTNFVIVNPVQYYQGEPFWGNNYGLPLPLEGVISYARKAGIRIPDISTAAKIPWLFTPVSEFSDINN
jgi:hypothetical protein